METTENDNEKMDSQAQNLSDIYKNWEKAHRRGRVAAGLIIVTAGSLYLAEKMGAILPEWLFTWQMLLIAIGIVAGVRHMFTRMGWLIPILIGTLFLLRDYYSGFNITHYVVPILVIVAGLFIIFRPRRRWHEKWHKNQHWQQHWQKAYWKHNKWKHHYTEVSNCSNTNDYIEINSVFGSLKKKIIAKDFKRGEISCVFGGAEINFMQADITEKAELEVNCVFGGVRLIIPSHWEVESGDLTAVMGGVEDKREVSNDLINKSNKVLVLRGSAVCGGIEIQSY